MSDCTQSNSAIEVIFWYLFVMQFLYIICYLTYTALQKVDKVVLVK